MIVEKHQYGWAAERYLDHEELELLTGIDSECSGALIDRGFSFKRRNGVVMGMPFMSYTLSIGEFICGQGHKSVHYSASSLACQVFSILSILEGVDVASHCDGGGDVLAKTLCIVGPLAEQFRRREGVFFEVWQHGI